MDLSSQLMIKALERLDELIKAPVSLIIGGGGAMILAHHFPLATSDIDAVPRGMDLSEIDDAIKQVAQELNIPKDWLNPYFSTFTHTLPLSYGDRLVRVFAGARLTADALSVDDLLIMKCFAHRQKDVAHARALIKAGANVTFVGDHIGSLLEKRIPGAEAALDFLDDVIDKL